MKIRDQKGFTLVETMVALGIFVVVSAIVFVGNGRFNNTILLTNLAYDLALTVSRAQSYGINVKQSDTSDPFNVGYGVHFKRGPSQTNPNESDDFSFVLFTDIPISNFFNHSYNNPSEFLERYLIRRGNYISKLWVNTTDNVTTELDVAFLRPDPDAYFTCSICNNATRVGIEVSSPDGIIKRNIIIGITGQISVE